MLPYIPVHGNSGQGTQSQSLYIVYDRKVNLSDVAEELDEELSEVDAEDVPNLEDALSKPMTTGPLQNAELEGLGDEADMGDEIGRQCCLRVATKTSTTNSAHNANVYAFGRDLREILIRVLMGGSTNPCI